MHFHSSSYYTLLSTHHYKPELVTGILVGDHRSAMHNVNIQKGCSTDHNTAALPVWPGA